MLRTMRSRSVQALPVVAMALTLAGCANPFGKQGYFRDKSGDYTKAESYESIQLPEEMSNTRPMGDLLVIPPISADHSNLDPGFRAPRPDQRLRHQAGDIYSIERNGDEQWLLAPGSPVDVWPQLLSFLSDNSIPLQVQDQTQGLMETQWVNLGQDKEHGFIYRTFAGWFGAEDAEPLEDRFQIDVKQGAIPDTSEIHIQHQARPLTEEGEEPAPVPGKWNNMPKRSPRMDNATLNELMLYLVRDEDDAGIALSQQNLNLGDRVSIVDISGNPTMTMDGVSFARAWAGVDQALVKAGLEVTDKNRSGGLFYILADAEGRVVKDQPKEKPGFFSRMFGSEEPVEEQTESTYVVRITELTGMMQVTVEESINAFAPADFSRKVLGLIQDNIN